MRSLRYILTLILGLVVALQGAFASTFLPPITYYASDEYRGESQNWCCDEDDYGMIYVANSGGLLRFDGYRWSCTDVPHETIVRSVLADGRRIYVGTFEQFGYFEPDAYGVLRYTSLSDALGSEAFDNDDIWSIRRCGSKVLFQSYNSIFTYDGKTVSDLRHESLRPLYIFVDDKDIYVQAMDDGLYKIEGNVWVKVIDASRLNSHIVALEREDKDTYLAFTERNGMLRWHKSGELESVTTPIDERLRREIINRVARASDGTLYIGTLLHGVYALGPDGALRWNYSADNGLDNNTVLGLHVDSEGCVWVMLDDGIACVHCAAPYEVMMPDRYTPNIGMVYSAVPSSDGNVLVASNQGLYNLPVTSGTLTEVEGMSGQNWNIARMDDGNIFVSNNRHSMCIRPDGRRDIQPFNSTCIRRCIIHGRDVLIQASYYNLRVYQRDGSGQWIYLNDVAGFGAPIRQIEVDASGALWCSHMSFGLYRIELDPTLRNVSKVDYFISPGAERGEGGACFVVKVRGHVLVADNEGLYEYDERERRFVDFDILDDCLITRKGICSVTPVDDSHFWIASRTNYTLVEYDGDNYQRRLTIPLKMLHRRNNGTNNSVSVGPDGMCYFTFNNGVGRCALSRVGTTHRNVHMRPVEATYLNNEGARVRLPLEDSLHAVAEGGNISLKYSMPSLVDNPCTFLYQLRRGSTTIEKYSDMPEITYADLRAGDYELTATALDQAQQPLTASVFRFTVPRSDWLSWWAIIIYVVGAGLFVMGASQYYNDRRMRERRKAFDLQQAENERLIHQKELIIAEQQKQLLERELTTKGKELAALAMSAYTKQQVIDSMKETLADQRSQGGSGYKVASALLKKIESADTGSREFWSVFELNFDLIHQHFFSNLKASYPALSPTDMKFCALLRLNLATKDIARFANISVRGVETARYRLRKKFGLREGESLAEFLISFKPDGEAPATGENPIQNS